MKRLKRLVAVATAVAMLGSTTTAMAQNNEGCEGVAYYDSYGCSFVTPTIGLGVIAIAAIIAVAVNNTNQGSSHQHS